jgi:hypothetical protein
MSQADATLAVPPQPDLPRQARKEACGALLTLALLQFGYAALLVVLPRLLGASVDPGGLAIALAWTTGLGVIAAALGVWARFRPLPAAVVGLGLFAVLTLLTVASASQHVTKGSVVQLIVQVVLAAILVKSIRTSLRLRRLPAGRPTSANGMGGEAVGGAPLAPGAKL